MLGFGQKAKAIKAATQMATDLVRLKEANGGIPPLFWRDPYVLGYFGGSIGTVAKLSSNGKLTGSIIGEVLISVFKALAGSRGDELWRNYFEASQQMSAVFQRGMLNGNKVVLYSFGSPQFDKDFDILEAVEKAENAKSIDADLGIVGTVRQRATSFLLSDLFLEQVAERFD